MKDLPKNRFFQGFSVSFIILLLVYTVRVSRLGYRRRLRGKSYIPEPFRENEQDDETERPQATPRDPYASAATELERSKRKKQ